MADESGYKSSFLEETKIATPELPHESALKGQTEPDSSEKEGDFNFQGSDLQRGYKPQSRETAEDGYGSNLLDATKIKTPEPKSESAVTLENPEGKTTKESDYNFQGSALERGYDPKPRETEEDGYGSNLLDETKIKTPAPEGKSAVTLGNPEGDVTKESDYNFRGSALDRGFEHKPREAEGDGYGSNLLDETKIKSPDPSGESAVTLGNKEGAETKEGDYNFEGSDLDRGKGNDYSSTILEKTQIKTPTA